jgi:hypothetical protein
VQKLLGVRSGGTCPGRTSGSPFGLVVCLYWRCLGTRTSQRDGRIVRKPENCRAIGSPLY